MSRCCPRSSAQSPRNPSAALQIADGLPGTAGTAFATAAEAAFTDAFSPSMAVGAVVAFVAAGMVAVLGIGKEALADPAVALAADAPPVPAA